MEMDHPHHHQYGISDLRQLISGRSPQTPQPPHVTSISASELLHRNLSQHLDLMMMGGGGGGGDHHHHHVINPRCGLQEHQFRGDSSSSGTGVVSGCCLEGGDVGGSGSGRWPRQETLTLLEIRSRLDPRFKEASQKGPLWDEVSRIMSEEHGYRRSGKKCREKFENLYKYYKKTKEGKAGRQDGKHYRFFRQLEALYGDNNSHNNSNSVVPEAHNSLPHTLHFHPPPLQNSTTLLHPHQHQSQRFCESLSYSNSSHLDASTSDDDVDEENVSSEEGKKVRRGKRSWKVKIKEFVDSQMRKLVEKQEAWVEKMMKALEEKEHERELREEEWKNQEIARIEREHKFWAKEKAWIEARDAAFVDALQKLTGRELKIVPPSPNELTVAPHHLQTQHDDTLSKSSKVDFNYFKKLRKENNSRWCYYPNMNDEVMYNQGGACCEIINEQGPEGVTRSVQLNEGLTLPSNSNGGNAVQDSCFRFMLGEGDNLWESYGVKLPKGDQNQ